jgi:hypothetical protein
MSLLETQNFLARLYTDESLRQKFLSEPEIIGRENNLSNAEIAELARILPQELNFFADSLFQKRLREVEKLLPQTRTILGRDFEAHFREFSQNFLPDSVKKHLVDAIMFSDFLQKKNVQPDWIKDLTKFEKENLIFHSSERLFMICRFRSDIRFIFEKLFKQPAGITDDFPNRKSFVVWLRIGKQARRYFF